MTLTSESSYQKEQGRRCLYPTALPMSTEQFSLIPLLALVLFFFPCSQTSVPSPLPMRALSPASKDSWMPREAAGGSEPRPLLCRHQNGWFLRYLNRTDTVSEHSESNSSPKVPIEGIEKINPHDVLYKSIYAQGQGLLPPPRQWEGTRPSVYQLCSQCANSYITLTTLLWGWQWIKHIFGT